MSFLLGTNTCSAFLKHRRGLQHRFNQHSGRLHIPTIVLGELYTWAYRRRDPKPTLDAIEIELLPHVKVLTFDSLCARTFGKTHAEMLSKGHSIEGIDLEIASVALVHDLQLVTHNSSDFRHVPKLRITDWLTAS